MCVCVCVCSHESSGARRRRIGDIVNEPNDCQTWCTDRLGLWRVMGEVAVVTKSGRGAQGLRTLASSGRTRARPPSPLGLGGQARRDPLKKVLRGVCWLGWMCRLNCRLNCRFCSFKVHQVDKLQKTKLALRWRIACESIADCFLKDCTPEVFYRRPGRVCFCGLASFGVLAASWSRPVASCRRSVGVSVGKVSESALTVTMSQRALRVAASQKGT